MLAFASVIVASPVTASDFLVVQPLAGAPELDGQLDDWASVAPVVFQLGLTRPDAQSDVREVTARAGLRGDVIYFAFAWEDDSENLQHKLFVWDDDKGRYITGPQREDRFTMQFEMSTA